MNAHLEKTKDEFVLKTPENQVLALGECLLLAEYSVACLATNSCNARRMPRVITSC